MQKLKNAIKWIVAPKLDKFKGVNYQKWTYRWYTLRLIILCMTIGWTYCYVYIAGTQYLKWVETGLSYTNHSF